MHVIVGLRNPESAYAGTRHNIGAEVVEVLAERFEAPIKRGPLRVRCDVAQLTIDANKVILALPRANMNVSGGPVSSLMSYYKAHVSDLLLIHDDLDLPYARLRLHEGRGSGGHNGVKSVMDALGSRDFWRLKIGLGRPPGRMDPAAYVLKRFSKEERAEMDILVQDAADVVERFVTDRERAVQLAGERGI
jgi:PTH1 family peptidyl-tRNA hydrolase